MRFILFAFAVLIAAPSWAVQPGEILDDPALESRAREISKDLRCLVCRNENIDDSHAALARDLRLLVRERLVAGDTDEETVAYVVERYGEFVLLNPRMTGGNLVLWLAGPALLLVGGAGVFIWVRRQRREAPRPPQRLSPEEEARLAELTRD